MASEASYTSDDSPGESVDSDSSATMDEGLSSRSIVSSLPLDSASFTIVHVTDILDGIAANGPVSTSARASPAPQGGPLPNGKPASPYVERNNPMGPNGSIAAQTVSSKDPKVAAQAASDMRNVVRRKLAGYVGFANLPNQWHRKSVRKGFNFNVMVVGRDLRSTFY